MQISVDDFFNQPAPSEGQYERAAHGETSHANQEPGTAYNVHMKGVQDVLQVVKEIQDTLKSELHDIRTKVDFIYAKFSSAEEKNCQEDCHHTNTHQKSQNHMPPTRSPSSTPTPPPPPPPRPLPVPTIQPPIIQVSSTTPRTLPHQHHQISNSSPSWMNPAIDASEDDGNAQDSSMQDQRIDDLYHVPPIATVPSLQDEV